MTRIWFILIILSLFLSYGCLPQTNSKLELENIKPANFIDPSNPNLGMIVNKSTICNFFKYTLSDQYYVDDMGNPYISEVDSINIIPHAIKTGEIKNAFTPKHSKDTNIRNLYYLLPRVRKIYDDDLIDTVITSKSNSISDQLSNRQIYNLFYSDAVIIGEVINKLYVLDTNNCYYYKGEYLIKVNEILHSYFNLDKEDVVLIKFTEGYLGGCRKEQPGAYLTSPHITEIDIGQKGIFYLNHSNYYLKFINTINNPNYTIQYKDKYCPKAFAFNLGNTVFTTESEISLNELRNFLHEIKNEN
ncbi:MAG: hypothetical protein ACR2GN_08595 [Bacteroidia bacterium]